MKSIEMILVHYCTK